MNIKKYDQSDMKGSIGAIPDQVEKAWAEILKYNFPGTYRDVNNIVVAGMGGSALGAHLIQNVFRNELSKPVTIISEYSIPKWINKQTLMILSSYSGNTEEVLSIAEFGKTREIPMIILATGGGLESFAERNQVPAVLFSGNLNTCGQPRIGLGYAVTYLLGIFRQLGFVQLSSSDISRVINFLRERNLNYAIPDEGNLSYNMAQSLRGKSVIIIGSEHLTGNAHIMANQWNENAKNMATWFAIPELNHHLLEGTSYPVENKGQLAAVMILSDLYDQRNQHRYDITRTILEKQGILCQAIKSKGETLLEQAFDILFLGTYASFYQAIINEIDPSPIPWVDRFKQLMAK